MSPMFRARGVLTAILMGLPALAEASDVPACYGSAAQDRIRQVSRHGDLQLASGKIVVLSGIRIPDDGPERQRALDWLKGFEGQSVRLDSTKAADRWDRQASALRTTGDSPRDLARGLVEAGLALVDAGVAETLCSPDLLAVEATARRQSLGIWAQDRYKPLDATQRDLLRERTGTFALVEGRVRSIGERQQRTYLNFGGKWAEDFTVIISRKTWAHMTERGITAASLKGSRIRARGILEDWQGAALHVKAPEMIERIEDPRPRR
jgi:hypothetical protein